MVRLVDVSSNNCNGSVGAGFLPVGGSGAGLFLFVDGRGSGFGIGAGGSGADAGAGSAKHSLLHHNLIISFLKNIRHIIHVLS